MTEIELKVFLDVTRNFFEKLGAEPAMLGPGIISFDDPKLLDFTGLIEIGGPSSGYVCLTMSRAMLTAVVTAQGGPAPSDVALAETVYEVTSVVANRRTSATVTMATTGAAPRRHHGRGCRAPRRRCSA